MSCQIQSGVYVAALHGDFARGCDLQEDMGNPPWVHWYPNWQREPFVTLQRLKRKRRLILLGYSSGAAQIAEWSHSLPNLVGAITYEGPVRVVPAGLFPVLLCWNRDSWGGEDPDLSFVRRQKRRIRQASRAKAAWKARDRVTHTLYGDGRHTRRTDRRRPRTLGIAHNWDRSLLPEQRRFIESIASGHPL